MTPSGRVDKTTVTRRLKRRAEEVDKDSPGNAKRRQSGNSTTVRAGDSRSRSTSGSIPSKASRRNSRSSQQMQPDDTTRRVTSEELADSLSDQQRRKAGDSKRATTRKQSAASSRAKSRNKAVDTARGARGAARKPTSVANNKLTSKEQEQLNFLHKKAGLSEKPGSDPTGQATKSPSTPPYASDEEDVDRTGNKTSTCSGRKESQRSSKKSQTRRALRTDDDDADLDDDDIPEDDSEDEDDDMNDNMEDDRQSNPSDLENNEPGAKIGESDDELEVSFNDGQQHEANEPADYHRSSKTANNNAQSYADENDENPSDSELEPELVNDADPNVEHNQLVNNRMDGVDESVVLNIVQSLKKSITSELQSSFHQVLSEMRSDRDRIQKLRDHISELTSIVTTTASAIFIKHTSSQPRGREIQRKLCLLPAFFNDRFMLKILPKVVIGFFINNVVSGSSFAVVESKGAHFFSLLYFSRQPSEKRRDKFGSDDGKVFSKFRYSFLTTSILAMQENSFNTFRNETSATGAIDLVGTGEAAEVSTVGPSVSAIKQPFWLKPGYFLEEHCMAAAKKQESRATSDDGDDDQVDNDNASQGNGDNESTDQLDSSQSSGKQKVTRTGPLTREEIATAAASMVYRINTSILYRARAAIKIQLFNDVLYLFTGWEQHEAPVDQSSLKIQWEEECTGNIDYIDDLPRTKIIRLNECRSGIGHEVDQIDIENAVHLETLISKHPELTLKIQHGVMVDGKERVLQYRINLIEVVCRALSSYVTLESSSKGKDVLRTDNRCFTAIIAMAVGLRRLMKKAVDDLNSTSIAPWANNLSMKRRRGRPKGSSTKQRTPTTQPTATKYKFEDVNGLNLEQLQAAASKQKVLLNHMILSITEEEYNSRMMHTDGDGFVGLTDNVGHVLGNSSTRLEADESQCVFRF